jgi:peptidoglycan-N-acetylglucosamine deacetylase
MKNFYISMDVEPDLHSEKYEFLKVLPKFLRLLKKYNIKATFFVTCDCIKKNPKLFIEIKKQGHELALHSYNHKRFDNRSFKEKEEDIKKSIVCFKKYLNITPLGFRAPQHSIDAETLDILRDHNFKYDSSIIPWNLYHMIVFWKIKLNYSHNFTHMRPYVKRGIFEIPISSFLLPFPALTLRLLPKKFLKIYLYLISLYKQPVFFMHSWDIIKISDSRLYNLCPLEQFLERLEFSFSYLSKKSKSDLIENLKIV